MAPGAGGDRHELEGVRAELRRLGYLSHRFERFLLQDALTPQRPWWSLLVLAAKVGTLAGIVLSLTLAFALAAANGNLTATPLDLLPLFLHLLPPTAAVIGVAFLALCALLTLVLRLYHVRRIETLSLTAALLAGAAALALAVSRIGDLADSHPWQLAVLALVAPLAIFALVKMVHAGLLTLAIRLTEHAPERRLFSRRWPGLVIVGGTLLLVVPAILALGRPPAPPPAALPSAPGDRVLLVGVDGVLPEEVDYLLARGELPVLAGLAGGGEVLRYRRPAEPPAAFWTTVATGLPSPDHGVAALDSFRPLGVETPLARSGPLRWYWRRIEQPLGLAEYRPVLSNRRRAFTVWELAARGGNPALAVGWWGTFPAEPLPGLVVAHGGYQLLGDGAAGAVAPAMEAAEVTALLAAARDGGGEGELLAAALPPPAATAVGKRAVWPDRFYRAVFLRYLEHLAPRAAALYLAAPDIAAQGWQGGDVALADLVRLELVRLDELLAAALAARGEDPYTVAVVLDPGRRGGSEGRLVLWRSAGCRGPVVEPAPRAPAVVSEAVAPGVVAAALLRALGLPQSAELPQPPAVCGWPSPPAWIATYGDRDHPVARPGAAGGEYLDSLKALGYL